MNSMVPSRRLLRQLATACHDSVQATPSLVRGRTICTASQQTANDSINRNRRLARQRLTIPAPTPRRHASASTTTPENTETPASIPLPDITNTYTLFPSTLPAGPPPTGPFTIPLGPLRQEFLRIQTVHHPDKHPYEPAHSKALALSALVNNAYKTLSDPLLRAQYLLLHNYDIDVNSEDNSAHASDAETLMEVMEAQERIEDAETEAQIDELRTENAERIEQTVQALGEAFQKDDKATATKECVRLKYWRSLGDGLNSWEPGKEVRLIH